MVTGIGSKSDPPKGIIDSHLHVWPSPQQAAEKYPCFLGQEPTLPVDVEFLLQAAAVEKAITLKPGEEWRGSQELSVVPSSYCSGQLDPQRVLRGG
ncbi:hypothetical protein BUALT_Bualt11G0032800 [Buddleja alternifolia]|uniref:2-amino-3-carboxymuconate-6-semialdehyde decarboxylase n=1 Tax=Buddleja alternifolia TaxID=168488 RepID=A0AAV6WSG5_9LAMI|nr:hypothetical protein BUALT_Bualt11G0032800 [Buddleja alternifolia]